VRLKTPRGGACTVLINSEARLSCLMLAAQLVCLERIDELCGVSEDEDNVRIGACTTHEQFLAASLVRDHLSVLSQAVRHLGSPPIRRLGTVGGNIRTASPAGDTLPPLFVLQAEVEVRSRDGVR